MKVLTSVFCAALMLAATALVAAELKSGVQPGEEIGAFDVVKCAGAVDDGVATGDKLCYRCKYGGRPMVMVFTRNTDEKVASLVKKLDAAVAKNADEKLAAFVNLLGEDQEALESQAKKFASKTKAENVPVVVPVEFENGPDNYGLNPKAEVTVILAVGGKVVANHAVSGELNDKTVAAILADVPKLLK
ncbi:MAG TPA: hypothetical protein VGN42_27365 [Pirellulales bacterium]|jgi:hypothetical protein|nr:hypothetical protein [Pirellulales bacterium]